MLFAGENISRTNDRDQFLLWDHEPPQSWLGTRHVRSHSIDGILYQHVKRHLLAFSLITSMDGGV